MAETGLMIVRDVDLSPACCCLDCPVDDIVDVCTAFQNDRPDKYVALNETDQYERCILSGVYHYSQRIMISTCIRVACLQPFLLS